MGLPKELTFDQVLQAGNTLAMEVSHLNKRIINYFRKRRDHSAMGIAHSKKSFYN
ncbi:hypothetical protein G9Q97_22975 [Cyclobacterium sp. GBPx2]|uniref:Uncharacterized protein n=1 Tax=Cyclobacterium plantarum TaxID=2716263 RepID=A0ABX0HEC8_9BACT|nr:hypothetical protein [Cyclobacterium plantarum]